MGKNSVKEMFQFATRPSHQPDGDTSPQPERKPRQANSMGKDAEIALLTARVAELEKSSVVEVRIDTLVIDSSRRRFRSPEKFKQLLELIKTQGQTDPIKVFRRKDGTVEVFEGHNRIEIHRLLNKQTIKAIFLDGFDLLQAEKLAVTSNSVQSESSTYYIYASICRLLSLEVEIDEACDLLGIKPKTYSQLSHLKEFPESTLDILRSTGLKIGANRIIYLAGLFKELKISEQALNRVINEIALDSNDAFEDIIADSAEMYPLPSSGIQPGASDGPSAPITPPPKASSQEISVLGKKVGKIVMKSNGGASIVLGPKAPSDLIEKISELIKNYK